MINIIKRLDREKYLPSVCVSKKGGTLDSEVEDLGIQFIEANFTVPAKPYLSLPSRARRAAKVFKAYQFEIWHSFHYLDDYTEPMISRCAGARAWIYTKKNMNWGRRSWHLRSLFSTRIAAQNSDMMNEFFSGSFYRKKALFIPRGVDTKKFAASNESDLTLRSRYEIPTDATVIGCVAHFVPVKGHQTLIQALSKLPGVYLLIAGKKLDEEYVRKLEKLIEELDLGNRILILDDVADIPSFLNQVDVFVLPTWAKWRQEGCPVSLLEAMACEKPCIATNISGSRDIIEHDSNGLLIPAEDVEAMANALECLIASRDLRERLGKAARKRVLEKFTIELEVRAHEAMYEEILEAKTLRRL